MIRSFSGGKTSLSTFDSSRPFARILWFWSAEENDASGFWPETVPTHSKEPGRKGQVVNKPHGSFCWMDENLPHFLVGDDYYFH